MSPRWYPQHTSLHIHCTKLQVLTITQKCLPYVHNLSDICSVFTCHGGVILSVLGFLVLACYMRICSVNSSCLNCSNSSSHPRSEGKKVFQPNSLCWPVIKLLSSKGSCTHKSVFDLIDFFPWNSMEKFEVESRMGRRSNTQLKMACATDCDPIGDTSQ